MDDNLPPQNMQDWFKKIRPASDEYRRVARDATLVGIIAARVRGNGFTNEIRVMCGDHHTGYSVRLSVRDGEITPELFAADDAENTGALTPIMMKGEEGMRIKVDCQQCGKTLGKVSPIKLLRDSVECIALMATRRPVLRF